MTESTRRGDHEHVRSPGSQRWMSTDEIADTYGDMADRLERWAWLERLFSGRFRRQQFGDVDGRVLDVACGTGSNFPYLPLGEDVVGIDISPDMVAQARDELDARALTGTVEEMDAQDLEFGDDSFDTVISSFSTCTFPDPVAALQEMGRVCRPDGEIRLLEHGKSDIGPIARFQNWRADAHYEKVGCRWNQEPLALVRRAGLEIEETDTSVFGILTRVTAAPA